MTNRANLSSKSRQESVSVLVLGTGIAGLTTALKFAEQQVDVCIVSKREASEGATRYAQGGIASVWSEEDTFESHVEDTLNAGAGLCHRNVVETVVREGPERVRELVSWGVPFTKRDDPTHEFDLHREGGHRKRRILHADDLTGWAIEKTLLERLRSHPRVKWLEHHIAVDLITERKAHARRGSPGRCLGAYVLNSRGDHSGEMITLRADLTVLATGGAGKVYLYTSNPDVATGDGVAMAFRAGARVANLEFMQFHPTCLYHPAARTFLITEALRGEGAKLRTLDGQEFMQRYHPMGALAPRDIVARAIDMEMKRTGDRHVWLDATALPAQELLHKFPNIARTCLDHGIDITRDRIPVVPAAHYMCGGVWVDLQGQTSVQGLYAVGEVAATGLHGANRLASNSLLEAVVYAHRVSEEGLKQLKAPRSAASAADPIPSWEVGHAVALEEQIDIAATWSEVRTLMWNYVGIVRSDRRLERAWRRLELIHEEVTRYYWEFLLTPDLIELRNLVTVARLIVQSAIRRKESRGLHFTVDYPETDQTFFLKDTVI